MLAAVALTVLATTVWLGSGLMIVQSGHAGVIFRFGVVDRTSQAGLGLRLPWPIEDHVVVDTTEIRRAQTGDMRLLTGDTNLVDVDLVVQYTAQDPIAFVTGLAQPADLVTATARSAATQAVAAQDVDTLLTTGRASLQRDVAQRVQDRLDASGSGIHIVGVEVLELVPPPDVLDAFNDVSSARGDKETLALAAESYASTVIPETRGAAALRVEEARAFASQRVAEAQGDVSRFEALLEEDGPALRARLHADAVDRIDAEVLVAQPGTQVVLPQESP